MFPRLIITWLLQQTELIYTRLSKDICGSSVTVYRAAKASPYARVRGRNQVITALLVAGLLLTLCSTLAPTRQSASLLETSSRVEQPTIASRRSTGSTIPEPSANACSPITRTSFSDDSFLTSDWDVTAISETPSQAGYAATHVATGGNPNGFWSIQVGSSGNTPNRYFGHLLKGYEFDPSKEGAIVSIDGGYDLKNQNGVNIPNLFALLLFQDGAYYLSPTDSIAPGAWSTFNHAGLKATDFLNISNSGPRNPVFSCNGKAIRVGFVALSSKHFKVNLFSGIDNWSIRFNSTCCNGLPPEGDPTLAAGGTDAKRGKNSLPRVTTRCCCDDEEALVDNHGTVTLPDAVDLDSPPIFEYVDQELGNVTDIYSGANTTIDTWCHDYPCKPAIGGAIPKDIDPNLDSELVEQGIEGVSADDIVKQLTSWEKMIAKKESMTPIKWKGPAAPNYTRPAKPHQAEKGGNIKYAFDGRDIVFVHGLKLEHIFDRISGNDPRASVKWKQPTSFPADSTNPEFYTGYYHERAERTWSGHIVEFLKNKGYRNRFLIVSYNCSDRLDVAVKSILTQIGDAMVYGTGVVDPLKPNAPPPKDFGTPSFVVVSHSLGGLVTDVALSAAAQVPNLNAAYIPKYCKAHIAVQGAHRGSKLATAAIVLSGYLAGTTPPWVWPLVRQIFVQMNDPPSDVPHSPFGFQTLVGSVLVDLVPLVAQQRWGSYIRNTPVRTLTVVGAHPTFLRPFKYLLQPGFDDAALTIESQVANPNNVLLWPSGFRTDTVGLVTNFDMGVFGVGPNTNVSVNIGGSLFNFSVNITSTSLNSPFRARGYYIDQTFDRFSSPYNVASFPVPYFFAAGATPYISPTGMLQTIRAEYARGSGKHPLSANPLNRNPNIFSFLQSASDHFKGTHNQIGGFNGVSYANSPFYFTANGERNFEETRVITDAAVYSPFTMPYGDNEPLLRPQNMAPVVERIRGLRVTFTVKFFRRRRTRTLWIWKRRYHLLDGWETKRQFDYVYESVLKN